jgi:hypothetical protein
MTYELFQLIGTVVFFVALCLVKACAEIEMEGRDGWAAKSATAYARKGTRLAQLHEAAMGGRPLSYWNVSEQVFFLLVWHVPLVTSPTWSLANEVYLLALMVAWMAIYDWCWFLFHPTWNMDRAWHGGMFRGAWWHPHRLHDGPLADYPADYPRVALVVCGLCGAYGWLVESWRLGALLLAIFPLSILAILLVHVAVGPWYHVWYHQAHAPENDGRSEYLPPH